MNRARQLLSGSAWNLVGQALPLVVAVLCIPWLIRLIGLERFGFISLAWVLVGYAGLFDMGLGRALIRTVAARLAAGDAAAAAASARTGLTLLLLLGVAVAALGLALSPWLVGHVLLVPAALHDEALHALLLLMASLPVVMLSSGFVAVLSAHQAFRRLNLIRAGFSTASQAVPLALAVGGWGTLPWVVGSIVAVRVLGLWAMAVACRQVGGWSWRPGRPEPGTLRELLQLGGWMSVSNLVGPLLSHLDRLLVGALVPLRVVGIYSVPYDLMSRLMVVPYAIVAAWFPQASSVQPGAVAAQALANMTRWLYGAMLPLLVVMMALAHPAMRLWLGDEIGAQAALVLQILIPGFWLNTLAQAPGTLIQAAGRPRDMALLHLLELPLFLALLWWLTSHHGIVGTAAAASLRMALDAMAAFALARRGVVGGAVLDAATVRALALPTLLALLLLGAASVCRSWPVAVAVALLGGMAVAVYGWLTLLRAPEREQIVTWLRRR